MLNSEPMARAILGAAVFLSAMTLSACGGDNGDETVSPSEWANSLCTDVGQWRSSLQTVRTSFKGNLTPENAQDAADQVGDATETLIGDLKDLGKPDTQSGQEASDDVDELSDELQKGSDQIQRAADEVSSAADIPAAAATIAATATQVSSEVKSTLTNLQQLDPQGELKTAIQQSSACQSLQSS